MIGAGPLPGQPGLGPLGGAPVRRATEPLCMRPEAGLASNAAKTNALDRIIRHGYVALAIFLAAFLARRSLDAIHHRVIAHPRLAFSPRFLRVQPRPNWVGDQFDVCVIRTLKSLEGCSVMHQDFVPELAATLRKVPWIREVKRVAINGGRDVCAEVEYRMPLARLTEGVDPPAGERDLFVDVRGRLLPDAGKPLHLPWLRSADGAPLDPLQRFVAAQEVAYLLSRTRGRGFIWASLLGLEVDTVPRLDQGRYSELSLVFQAADGTSRCRFRWGRGQAEARPADVDSEVKFSNLESILECYPGWRGIRNGVVAFRAPCVLDPERPLEANARSDALDP